MDYYQPKNQKEVEIFTKFKKEVLKLYIPKHRGFQNYFVRRNFLYLGYVALALMLINIGIFFFLFLNYNFSYISKKFAIVSLAIFSGYSLGLFIISFFAKKMRTTILRHIQNIYYLLVIFISTIIIIIENAFMTSTGAEIAVETLSIAIFYLVIFIFLPACHTADMCIINALMLIAGIIPEFLQGNETYNILFNILIRLLITGAYLTMFFIQKKLYKKSESLNTINDNLIITAHKDPLTFSMNRLALDTYWKYLQENNDITNVGVIMFDIDNFKSYNDTYSHIMGDNVLTTICKVVTNALIDRGLYFFRYGGEEFMVLLENPSDDDVVNLGLELKNAVYDANLERSDIKTYDRVTITVGCSNLRRVEMLHGDFVSKADKSLYKGKNATKNCVVFNNKIYYK